MFTSASNHYLAVCSFHRRLSATVLRWNAKTRPQPSDPHTVTARHTMAIRSGVLHPLSLAGSHVLEFEVSVRLKLLTQVNKGRPCRYHLHDRLSKQNYDVSKRLCHASILSNGTQYSTVETVSRLRCQSHPSTMTLN